MVSITSLPDRGVIAIDGEDRVAFLQGLVSNDVAAARAGQAVWAALLTAQGKWLADFFVFSDGDRLLLDCEQAQAATLVQRLSRYRLRMRVALRLEPALHVHVAWQGVPAVGQQGLEPASIMAPDPRLPDFAWRILSPALLPATASPEDWDLYRLTAGLPDGSKDMEADRTVLLEAGFDELAGVSWTKGCYMGQELTARTKYRGLIKRRLLPVAIQGLSPPPGTPVLRDGIDVGTMRSAREGIGLASLRLDAAREALRCGDATLIPSVPAWMRLPV